MSADADPDVRILHPSKGAVLLHEGPLVELPPEWFPAPSCPPSFEASLIRASGDERIVAVVLVPRRDGGPLYSAVEILRLSEATKENRCD